MTCNAAHISIPYNTACMIHVPDRAFIDADNTSDGRFVNSNITLDSDIFNRACVNAKQTYAASHVLVR